MTKAIQTLFLASCAILLTLPIAAAADEEDSSSWFGQSGSRPIVHRDTSTSGFWWWSREPSSNQGDEELWGNRGVVFGKYVYRRPQKPEPEPEPEAALPEPVAAPEPAPVVEPPMIAKLVEERPTIIRELTIFSNVLFEFDKAELKPEGQVETDKVIAELVKYADDTVAIEGHTCNIGEEEYNAVLGQRRADAVAKYLSSKGIGEERVSAATFGERQPAVDNDTPENRQLNRRVVFKITIGN